jgi:hypothetical protein
MIEILGLVVLIAAVGGTVLMRLANKKTLQHEAQLSLPPALVSVKHRLGSLALDPITRESANRARDQLQRLESGLKQASEILQRKLNPGELAYSRFQNGLQSAGAAVFSELQEATDKLVSQAYPEASAALDENEKTLGAFASAVKAISAMETDSHRVELPAAIHELEQISARAKNLSLPQGDSND